MQRSPEGLIFLSEEAPALRTILSHYLPLHRTDLPPGEVEELQKVWEQASDMLLANEWLDGASSFSGITAAIRKLYGREPRIVEKQTFICTAATETLKRAIGWASLNFAPNTPFLTGEVSLILNSDYMGLLSQCSTNEGLAQNVATNILAAGSQARSWNEQLKNQ